jgi:hypothetical protein
VCHLLNGHGLTVTLKDTKKVALWLSALRVALLTEIVSIADVGL